MTLSLYPSRHMTRAMRVLAGLIATFVLTGNVLAAAGLCAIKVRAAQGIESISPDSAPCPQHIDRTSCSAHADAVPHCNQEDPGAQARAVDLPAASILSAPFLVALPCLHASAPVRARDSALADLPTSLLPRLRL